MDLLQATRRLSTKVEALVNGRTALSNAEVFRLREEIRADANSIAHIIDGPEQAIKAIARGYTTCTALKICIDIDLPRRLSQTGSCAIEELASTLNCDRRILRPVLRLLAQHGIFQQSSDGRWRHTHLSEVMERPPFLAWMKSILEEKYRATAHLPRLLKETEYRAPSLPGHAAFNAVYGTSLDFYTYSNDLDHEAAVNFAVSMEELARNQLPFFEGSYPLDRLDTTSHFVDVAGGMGNLTHFLAGKFPQASFEVQDHPFIVEQARQACPAPLRDRITFRGHDFLIPQPERPRSDNRPLVFLLKIILHDHGDAECKIILNNLLSAMQIGDRLLIIDTVIPEVGGSLSSCNSDLIILSMFGCGHRTLREFDALIRDCAQDIRLDTFTGGAEEFDGMMIIEAQKLAHSS